MKCAICDKDLPDPKFNKEIGNFDPCDTCMEVVQATLDTFNDRPYLSEDELDGGEVALLFYEHSGDVLSRHYPPD